MSDIVQNLRLADLQVSVLTDENQRLRAEVAILKEQHNSLLNVYRQNMQPVSDLQEQNALLAVQGQEVVLYMARNLHSNSYATSRSKAEAELFLMQSGLKNDGIEAEVIPLCALTALPQQVKSEDTLRIEFWCSVSSSQRSLIRESYEGNGIESWRAAIDAAMSAHEKGEPT